MSRMPVRTEFNAAGKVVNVTGCPRMYLTRRKKANADGSVSGCLVVYRSVIAAGSLTLPTIERGNGYVSLKMGMYIMKHDKKNTGRTVKCLRPTEGAIKTILIHDAYQDKASQLAGCVAPGLQTDPSGAISGSAEAMQRIWEYIGGWSDGALVKLDVLSNVPGDSRTRETWGRLQ